MDIRPKVSPDGSKICFVSTRDGNYEIYVMNIDGSDVVGSPITRSGTIFLPGIPMAIGIVYVSERDGQKDIFLVDIPKPIKVTAK